MRTFSSHHLLLTLAIESGLQKKIPLFPLFFNFATIVHGDGQVKKMFGRADGGVLMHIYAMQFHFYGSYVILHILDLPLSRLRFFPLFTAFCFGGFLSKSGRSGRPLGLGSTAGGSYRCAGLQGKPQRRAPRCFKCGHAASTDPTDAISASSYVIFGK